MKKQTKILLSSAMAVVLLATLGTAAGWAASNGSFPFQHSPTGDTSPPPQELEMPEDSSDFQPESSGLESIETA